MVETYAFLAMFTIQILVGSVLNPALFVRRVRPPSASFPVERFSELFPGVSRDRSAEHFATRYRVVNAGIALLGLVLVGWLYRHMGGSDGTEGAVVGLLTLYFIAQISPVAVVGWKAARTMKALKTSLVDRRRRAVMRRRGLFDFVSPFLVFLAVLSYALFVALVLYVRQHPFPGYGGLTNIVIITLVCALGALLVYRSLYGTNPNPVATHSNRLYTIGVIVKTWVYACIAATAFASLVLTLPLLHLQSWELFAVSVFFVLTMLGTSIGLIRGHRPTASTGHTEVFVPATELEKCVGRYSHDRGFAIAIARDGTKLWWLRLDVAVAQPVPIFPESPLAFFWKDIDQQIRFTTEASGAVTGAEIAQGGHTLTLKRTEPQR